MKYYFVDFENVKSEGLVGIKTLHKQDKVFILYSKNANKLEIGLVKDIFVSSCDISFLEIENLGKNALDFQLCTLLGNIIGKFRGSKLDLLIISKDKGYDAVVNGIPKLLEKQLQQKNIKLYIKRKENLEIKEKKNKTKTTNLNSEIFTNIEKLLKNTKQEKNIEKIINLVKGEKNLTKIHNALVMQFKEDGKRIYITIRPELKKIVNKQ